MIHEVNDFIKKHQLLTSHSIVVVGVSGGPDSLALLHFFHSIREEWNLSLIAAHVDHMFRGEESLEDLHFVQNVSHQLNIKFVSERVNVPDYQHEHKVSPQVAARECRYAFFRKAMEKEKADFLALGHHGDDQIETMLMRQVRGSFGIGLAGIRPIREFANGKIIRPFLTVTKDQIERYCHQYELNPRRDPTNQKDDYMRNRFRHHILPFLKQENELVHKKYQSLSEVWIEEQEYLTTLAMEKLDEVVVRKDEREIVASCNRLSQLAKPLQRRTIHLILNYLYRKISPSHSSTHIENILVLLERKHPSGILHFPSGLNVIRSYDNCIFSFENNNNKPYRLELDVPGRVNLPNGGVISAQKKKEYPMNFQGNNMFVCPAEMIGLPLTIRTRDEGDRMSCQGMKGNKKVKKIFIDQKIPRIDRDRWPIVEDASGNILWIPGLKKSSIAATKEFQHHECIVLQYEIE
jgi:tRNA(Ile)-lysidine synthase